MSQAISFNKHVLLNVKSKFSVFLDNLINVKYKYYNNLKRRGRQHYIRSFYKHLLAGPTIQKKVFLGSSFKKKNYNNK